MSDYYTKDVFDSFFIIPHNSWFETYKPIAASGSLVIKDTASNLVENIIINTKAKIVQRNEPKIYFDNVKPPPSEAYIHDVPYDYVMPNNLIASGYTYDDSTDFGRIEFRGYRDNINQNKGYPTRMD